MCCALGGIASSEALAMVVPYLSDPGTKEEASAAILSISGRLMGHRKSARLNAPKVIGPLQKAAQTTTNAHLANRAKSLLKKAQGMVPRK